MYASGRLSNQEVLEAIRAAAPHEQVVLLQLPRQWNEITLVADMRVGSEYALRISSQYTPTGWIGIPRSKRPHSDLVSTRITATQTLWSAV